MVQSKGTARERKLLKDAKPGMRNWRKDATTVLAMLALMFPLWGGGERKIDQLVVDVSNMWRNKLGAAVTDALLKYGRIAARLEEREAVLDERELEEFVKVATESLWARTNQIVNLLKIIKATHLLLGLDGKKEMMLLMNKGRVGNTAADGELSKHDIGRMLGQMRKWMPEKHKHSSASNQEQHMRKLVSDMLH